MASFLQLFDAGYLLPAMYDNKKAETGNMFDIGAQPSCVHSTVPFNKTLAEQVPAEFNLRRSQNRDCSFTKCRSLEQTSGEADKNLTS